MPIKTHLIFYIIIAFSQTALSAEWKEAELSGTFSGWGETTFGGSGKTYYSFALEKPTESSGDVRLEVCFPDQATSRFRINGAWFYDIGPLPQPPVKITTIPNNFGTEQWRANEPSAMLVGHYYLLLKKPKYILIQVLDFTASDIKFIKRGMAWNTYEGLCTVRFRYLPLCDSIDQLNALLSGKADTASQSLMSAGKKDSNEAREKSAAKENEKKLIESDEKQDKNFLLNDYEKFQKDAKDFMNLPTEEATIARCDKLLEKAKTLNTQTNDLIWDKDSTITGNNAKISSLQERLAKITDLQLKDRVLTRITKIKAETEKLQNELKEWTARLDELQKTEKKLKEYRLIIGI
jgi:hypothetical protein